MKDYVEAADFDGRQAHAEGWGLYSASQDEALITDLRQTPTGSPFADGIAAREHVAARIMAGDLYHIEAVRHLRRLDIEGYKVFREEHPECAERTDIDPMF